MLVLTRKPGEIVEIGLNVFVRVVAVQGGKVRLGIEAPNDVKIMRAEIANRDTRPQSNSGKSDRPLPVRGGRIPRAA